MSLAKIQAPPLTQNIAETAESKKAADTKKVGQDFEAILVRQMLAQTNIGGKGGYSDMATEALASAVTKGGGLGLGKIIERQLAPHQASETAAKSGTTPAAAVSAFKKLQGDKPELNALRSDAVKPLAPTAVPSAAPVSPAAGTVFSIPKK